MHKRPNEAARVDPNRKWFGNVRTIDQKSLEKLRIEMARKEEDPISSICDRTFEINAEGGMR